MLPDDYGAPTVYMDAVVEGPDGQLVAVGGALDEDGESVAAAWSSTDGQEWERVVHDATVFSPGTIMDDVTWGEHGFVAVGSDDGSEAGIWHSPDGLSWTRIDTTDQPFDPIGSLSSVAALDSGYTSVGVNSWVDDGSGWVTLWTSPDGLEWDRVHAIGEGYTSAVVVADGGIAVAGGMSGDDNVHASVWVGPLFDPEAPPPDPGPPPAPAPDEAVSRIGTLEEGASCEELAAEGFSYAEAVSHWARYELTDDFDLDTDGSPCRSAYPEADVIAIFGEPAADSMVLVGSYQNGSFAITGSAADFEFICKEGTFGDTENVDLTDPTSLWRWTDIYRCSDDSGTFTLAMNEYINAIDDGDSIYNVWDIVSGTDRYEGLRGGGVTVLSDPVGHASIGRLWFETNEN